MGAEWFKKTFKAGLKPDQVFREILKTAHIFICQDLEAHHTSDELGHMRKLLGVESDLHFLPVKHLVRRQASLVWHAARTVVKEKKTLLRPEIPQKVLELLAGLHRGEWEKALTTNTSYALRMIELLCFYCKLEPPAAMYDADSPLYLVNFQKWKEIEDLVSTFPRLLSLQADAELCPQDQQDADGEAPDEGCQANDEDIPTDADDGPTPVIKVKQKTAKGGQPTARRSRDAESSATGVRLGGAGASSAEVDKRLLAYGLPRMPNPEDVKLMDQSPAAREYLYFRPTLDAFQVKHWPRMHEEHRQKVCDIRTKARRTEELSNKWYNKLCRELRDTGFDKVLEAKWTGGDRGMRDAAEFEGLCEAHVATANLDEEKGSSIKKAIRCVRGYDTQWCKRMEELHDHLHCDD